MEISGNTIVVFQRESQNFEKKFSRLKTTGYFAGLFTWTRPVLEAFCFKNSIVTLFFPIDRPPQSLSDLP